MDRAPPATGRRSEQLPTNNRYLQLWVQMEGGAGAGAGVTRLHPCTVFNLEKPPTNAFLKVLTIATSRNAKWEMVDVDTHQLLTLQPCVPILHLLTMFKMPVSS